MVEVMQRFQKKCITNGLNHEWTVGTDFIGPSVFIETKNIEKILKKMQKPLVLSFYLC